MPKKAAPKKPAASKAKASAKKTAAKNETGKNEDKPVRRVKTPELLRGFRDILLEDQMYWEVVEE